MNVYATTKPACINLRNALDQHTNSSGAIRAINILIAITGNLDVKGGNIIALPVLMAPNDVSLNDKLPPEALKKKIGGTDTFSSESSTCFLLLPHLLYGMV